MFYVINISIRENCLQSLRKNKDIKNGCKAHFISLTFIYIVQQQIDKNYFRASKNFENLFRIAF